MHNIMSIDKFDDYMKLTNEQKEFYTFEQLSKIDVLIVKIKDFDKKYSRKWVEKCVIGFIVMILVAFATAVIAGIIPTA